MKTITKIITSILVLVLLNVSYANRPSYKLKVINLNYTTDKSLEFDIYLVNTESDEGEFKYSLGQYFFEFNLKIANGGTLTYTIIESDLPELLRPRNASVSDNQLRLASNSISPDKDNFPIVSKESHGLLIARMKLETTSEKFTSEPLNLKWTDSKSKFQTKIFSFIDNKNVELTNSKNHEIDLLTENSITQNNTELPKQFSLLQNYPNPFNPETKIKFDIPSNVRSQTSNVKLIVYDMLGKEVITLVDKKLDAGRYEVSFNGSSFSSGVYFYRISAGSFSQTMRMLLIK